MNWNLIDWQRETWELNFTALLPPSPIPKSFLTLTLVEQSGDPMQSSEYIIGPKWQIN